MNHSKGLEADPRSLTHRVHVGGSVGSRPRVVVLFSHLVEPLSLCGHLPSLQLHHLHRVGSRTGDVGNCLRVEEGNRNILIAALADLDG